MPRSDLLLVGPFARTRAGGIRSHVRRLRELAELEALTVRTVDPKTMALLSFPWRAARSRIVHLHNSNGILSALMALWARLVGARVITTIHGDFEAFRLSHREGFVLTGKLGASVVALNQKTADALRCRGLTSEIQSAYLPPTPQEANEKQEATEDAADKIYQFGRTCSKLFLTYTMSGSFEHRELYGIDTLITLFGDRANEGLVILVSSAPEELIAFTSKMPNVTVIAGDIFVPQIASYFAAFLRNTTTDGDSLLVRECLNAGIGVIATNVVDRPPETSTYPHGDLDSLRKLLARFPATRMPEANGALGRPSILTLYDRLLGRNEGNRGLQGPVAPTSSP